MKPTANAATNVLLVGFLISLSHVCAQEGASPKMPDKADPAAYRMLEAATESRMVWPANFAGFTADVVFNDNGKVTKGAVDYTPKKGAKVEFQGLEKSAMEWVDSQLNSLLSHRRGVDFAKGNGRHPLAFGEDDNSPLGRLIYLNDSLKSSYRVRDGRTTDVTRTMGADRFTISVLDTTTVEGGKYLPRSFVVTYFDAKTGAIKRVEAFNDSYQKKGEVWYPEYRRIVRAENGSITARAIEFQNVRPLSGHEQTTR